MRSLGLLLFVCALSLFAQSPQSASPEDPEVARARIEVDRVRALVETGTTPRAQLQKAEDALADASDAAAIRQSVYAKDLTEDQADALVAAADRRFERRKKAFDEAKNLVDAGVMPAAETGSA